MNVPREMRCISTVVISFPSRVISANLEQFDGDVKNYKEQSTHPYSSLGKVKSAKRGNALKCAKHKYGNKIKNYG